jgi:hypothetical protein
MRVQDFLQNAGVGIGQAVENRECQMNLVELAILGLQAYKEDLERGENYKIIAFSFLNLKQAGWPCENIADILAEAKKAIADKVGFGDRLLHPDQGLPVPPPVPNQDLPTPPPITALRPDHELPIPPVRPSQGLPPAPAPKPPGPSHPISEPIGPEKPVAPIKPENPPITPEPKGKEKK